MLMANLKAVLQRPKVSASYSRNAFDRSFSPKVHYPVGGLQPFMAEPLIAGSHIKLNRSIFQRTAAVNTAAFPKVDTHCEFFFVPMRLLWSYWNNFKLNIQDFNSSYMGSISGGVFTPTTPTIPLFNLATAQHDICKFLSDPNHTGSVYSTKHDAVGANRLFDTLGYGYVHTDWTYTSSNPINAFQVNPFKLLAYQKIYYDHFRNTAYENNDPSYYNIDAFTGSNLNVSEVAKISTYRFVNYRKDYFQAVYPSLNYTVSSPVGNNWNIPDSVMYHVGGTYGQQSSVSNNLNSGGQTNINTPSTDWDAFNVITVQQVRAAFALDKLLRASAYAPKHVKDQFEARYGIKGVESGNESIRIGAFMNDIVFQEVTNMADTNSNLGEIGGKGVGYAGYGKDIEFTAKEDGILMGLIYSLPRTSYDSDCLKNWNVKSSREDFFVPEFMDLGLQPLPWYEARWKYSDQQNANHIIGYKTRYSEYKTGIDVNHGLFNAGELLSDFVTHSNSKHFGNFWGYGSDGVTSYYFKVDPRDLDSVFVQSTDVKNTATDKFFTYLDIKFICNQNMSVHGQPKIGGF